MKRPSLFRAAALEARQVNWLADVVLIRPLTFTMLTGVALAFASVILAFLAWGSYTKRTPVTGQLVPDSGLVKVYAPQPGVVLQKFVSEGQAVKRGEVLYVLSSERHSSTQGDTQAAISSQVEARQQSLREELAKSRALLGEEREALQTKIAGLQAELAKLDGQIEDQRRRVKLAEESVARYQGLLAQDYISREQAQQKQEELLDQRNRVRGMERDHIAVARELAAQRNELATLAPRQQNRLAQVERSLASTGQELSESEARRRLLITAPEAGVATALGADVGQWLDTSRPLLSVVPAGATLQAHLYAQSRAVGFIKPGDAVLVRYQAYPYQKFGHAKGVVKSVSRTALPAGELGGNATANPEPLYRVTVTLAAQSMPAYGKQQALQAGMLLDADILQETRRLYEWVLEPLYSLTGKL
ncbi:HlyD family secretion protein [Janthinobacterium fluminis]|uniref:HlyD family efflux transporter periplasmic adaptor subunit n=1 Tax=Janthinobacterium fluminis TaxID=2987524 RepID=A0ABT5JVN5_9BURK|nr:HlyD family efflux transporter periplasmic adaptor subunit [Janthinobacterium fluminis]MDC8756787.1 HlyD family efflux transporter periplasmic adaptor subunit [Janthinobacterium fluminis]